MPFDMAFARAVGAEQPDQLSPLDVEVDAA